MAEKETDQKSVNPDEVFITVTFNQKTGALYVHSNTSNQITQLGMLSMADAAISKPKESPLLKPMHIPAFLGGKKS